MLTNGQDIEFLFHRKWTLTVLAELQRQGGSKFVTLSKRLGIGPSALRLTLDFLIERGVVVRNHGHGHPMRPEYLVTEFGSPIAERCRKLLDEVHDKDVMRLLLMKWSIPTLLAIGHGSLKFSAIRNSVSSVTARALTQFLKEGQFAGAVVREVTSDYPPAVQYSLSDQVAKLVPLIRNLTICS